MNIRISIKRIWKRIYKFKNIGVKRILLKKNQLIHLLLKYEYLIHNFENISLLLKSIYMLLKRNYQKNTKRSAKVFYPVEKKYVITIKI